MTKKEVVDKVKSLKLPRGSYVVYGAAPLAIYGIRDVRDVDMYISHELYQYLKNLGWKKIVKGPNDEPIVKDIFEAHETWDFSPYAPTFDEVLSRSVTYQGITLASIEDILKWKVASGRPKDLTDIKLIDAYIAYWNSSF